MGPRHRCLRRRRYGLLPRLDLLQKNIVLYKDIGGPGEALGGGRLPLALMGTNCFIDEKWSRAETTALSGQSHSDCTVTGTRFALGMGTVMTRSGVKFCCPRGGLRPIQECRPGAWLVCP